MSERGGRSQEMGEDLPGVGQADVPCVASRPQWPYDAHPVPGRVRPLRRAVAQWLTAGQTCGVTKTEGVCREMLKVSEALELFVCVEDVEPTNNTAERAIHPGVLWCKGSFGTQRAQGLGLSRP